MIQSRISRGGNKIRLAALAAVAGFASFGAAAHGQFVWDGGGSPDNNWNTAANWNPDGTPGAGDSAQWTLNGGSPLSSTVELTQNQAANDLQVVERAVAFNLNNFQLSVGGGATTFDGNSADATFNGPGGVSFGGPVTVGLNLPDPGLATHARLTAQNGVAVSTARLNIAAYRGGGIVTVDGAGTVWNSTGEVYFNLNASGYNSYTQPRAQLLIKNGAHFNHDLDAGTFNVARGIGMSDRIDVDGPGSQLNFTGEGTNLFIGGYAASATTTWNITNGGVVSHTNPANAENGIGLSANNQNGTAGVNTFNISGTGSKMRAATIALSARSTDALFTRGPSVVNVGVGGTLEATNADGGDRSVAVYDLGRLALQGGTVSAPTGKDVVLMDTGVPGQATLEGNGTIAGGNLRVQGDSIVRPGAAGTGTLTLQNGSLTVESPSAQLLFDLSTSTAAHDRISLSASGQSASVPGVISYSNLGSGNAAQGILDFLVADTINYNAFSTGDITLNTDNLDAILASAGYTKVTGANPTAADQYRYFIANDVNGSLDALRLVLGVPATGPTVTTWISPTAGDWNNAANWSAGIPNGVDAEAKFLSAISSTSTVFTDVPVTVGTMRFNNSSTYHVTGGGSLTLQVSTGSALVDVAAGTHKINLPLIVASNTNLNVAGGATLKISDPVTINSGVNVTQSGAGNVLYESIVTVGPAASIQFANSSHMNALNLGAAASATVTPGMTKVLRADSVNVAAGKLDLKDNKLITNKSPGTSSGGTYGGLQGDVQSAYDFGAWDGNGLTTSQQQAIDGLTTIGVGTGESVRGLGPNDTDVFAGQTITGSSTIAMYTYAGDANLDGTIDGGDYGIIDNFVQVPNADSYFNGDFNYDGVIDGGDYGIIDNNIQAQGAPFPTSGASVGLSGVTAVPEPAALSVLGVATAGLLVRRRRRGC